MAEQNYNSTATEFFPKSLSALLRKRTEAADRPLSSGHIASLMSMRFNREPLYASIDEFYSPEYLAAMQANAAPAELNKIARYRKPTNREINLLYGDIHAKDEPYTVSGSNQTE